uniref:Cell surface glycoprotein CD200 receptor 1-like n=1 Tax=Monodelphis domestica TaxID=13616 RepID=F7F1Q7_MONDO
MNPIWKSFGLMLLTILISFLIPESKNTRTMAAQAPSSNTSTTQMSQQISTKETYNVSAQVDTKTVLSCYIHQIKSLVMLNWEILLRDTVPCIIAYRKDTNETKETNCSGEGINWESRADWDHELRINPVTIANDGDYKCEFVTPEGNFERLYHLSVVVPPLVNLSNEGDESAVCKAAAGKPAARITWVPEGVCVTSNETHDNRTVTVTSSCSWKSFNGSRATCFISHLTGNSNLSIEYHGLPKPQNPTLRIIITAVFMGVLAIVGLAVLYKKSNDCRNCKSSKPEATPCVGEDEVEPYASYTEKNNPLYDTRTEVKISKASQSEDFGLAFQGGLTR